MKERGTDTETQISTQEKKETERRKRQAAGRKEYCMMLSRERKITLQRQEHTKHWSTTINAGSIHVWKENIRDSRAQTTRGEN